MRNSEGEKRDKPILALDVDGPLALFGTQLDEGTLEVWAGDIPVSISRKLEGRLRVLARHFQIVWSTSWERSAGNLIAPLVGLPGDLPFIPFDLYPAPSLGESRKLPGLKGWLRDVPVAIVDDEIGRDMQRWAAARTQPTLLVEIDPRFGIQDKHVIQLVAFSLALSDGANRLGDAP